MGASRRGADAAEGLEHVVKIAGDEHFVVEKIFHMAGSQTPQGQTVATLERAIREAGRIPIQRDTFYQQLNGQTPPGKTIPSAITKTGVLV